MVREIYRFRDIKRDQERIVQWEIQRRKEAVFPDLHRKPLKSRDKGLDQSTQGHRRPLEQQRVARLWLPLAWVLEPRQISRHGQPLYPRWESARKQSKNEKKTWGNQSFQVLARPLLPGKTFILLVVHRDKCKKQSHAGSAALTQAFFLHTHLYTQILGYFHHLLARRPISIYGPFLIRVSQPENLFALKVLFLLKSGAAFRKH